jgi:hypothetical protein
VWGVQAKGLTQRELEMKIWETNQNDFKRVGEVPFDPAWEEQKIPGMDVKKAIQSLNMDKRYRNEEN